MFKFGGSLSDIAQDAGRRKGDICQVLCSMTQPRGRPCLNAPAADRLAVAQRYVTFPGYFIAWFLYQPLSKQGTRPSQILDARQASKGCILL